MTTKDNNGKVWKRCKNCNGFGGFEATKLTNGGLCPICKGHGGFEE